MKEPFRPKEADSSPKRKGKQAGTRRLERRGKKPRRRLPRVRGGKALARLNFFKRQRQARESDTVRKAQSPYLTAFAEKSHLARTAPAGPVEQAWRPLGPF